MQDKLMEVVQQDREKCMVQMVTSNYAKVKRLVQRTTVQVQKKPETLLCKRLGGRCRYGLSLFQIGH